MRKRYWLGTTSYRNAQDELCERYRIYPGRDPVDVMLLVPDNEWLVKTEEIFEDDIELFDCEVVR